MRRNFKDPLYVKWRKAVYARDRGKCRMPGCDSSDGLNAHHIKRWANFPELRTSVSNGVSLCRAHHAQVTGREEEFEEMFIKLLNQKSTDISLSLIMMRHEQRKD